MVKPKPEKLGDDIYCPECAKIGRRKRFYCRKHRYAYKKWYLGSRKRASERKRKD